jgi:chromosome segregation ATPase
MSDSLSGDLKADDIPKEELLHLCMKMNKRMQAMETKGKELLKKKNSLQNERQNLLKLIEVTVDTSFPTSPEQDLDISQVEKIWNEWDLNRLAKMKDYEKQVQELKTRPVSTITDESAVPPTTDVLNTNESVSNKASASDVTKLEIEVEKLKILEKQLKEQLKSQEQLFSEKSTENDNLRKEMDIIKNNCEEKIVYMQMSIHQSKQREEKLTLDLSSLKTDYDKSSKRLEEKEILLQTNKDMLVSLQSRLIEIEPELSSYKEKMKELERRFSSLQLLKYEQDNMINSLRSDCRTVTTEKEKLLMKCKELEDRNAKSDSQNTKIVLLNEEINTLKEEIEEKSSVITRLRSEISTNEKNHAIRVAMLATSEQQVLELKKIIEKKEEENKEFIDRIASLQINYSSLEQSLKEKVKENEKSLSSLEKQLSEEKDNYNSIILSLKSSNEENIENMKKDFNKRSAMARSLLSEKEDEIRLLSLKVHELQDEISSGAPSERKIFELAQLQSKRESLHGIHRDTREIAFQQLQSALARKDYELAQAQQILNDLSSEMNELRKIKQREGINMDYLKNVVFQVRICILSLLFF